MMALRSSPPGGAGLAAAPPNTVEIDSHGTSASISILARFSSALFARTTHPPAVCGTGGGGGGIAAIDTTFLGTVALCPPWRRWIPVNVLVDKRAAVLARAPSMTSRQQHRPRGRCLSQQLRASYDTGHKALCPVSGCKYGLTLSSYSLRGLVVLLGSVSAGVVYGQCGCLFCYTFLTKSVRVNFM